MLSPKIGYPLVAPRWSLSLLLLLALLLTACAPKVPPTPKIPPVPPPAAPARIPAQWQDLPGWRNDDHAAALQTFLQGCTALQRREDWKPLCDEAATIDPGEARIFFELRFEPWQLQQEDGTTEGMITGYYGPELQGRRTPGGPYRYPIYGWPQDMLVVDLSSLYPELSGMRLRGRVEGRRLVPYWSREEIARTPELLRGQELLYVADPVDLYYLHIQGSGRIVLEDGTKVMVGYENQNGHPYRSIGKLLIDRGQMTRDQMSMQNIKAWGQQHPDQIMALLAENPSYIFFHELPPEITSPPGSLGTPLVAERSLAVDTRTVPLGAPVYLATTRPDDGSPLQRLMVAQDTGGAIKGRVRADFFWGMGTAAGELAGRMKQQGRMWLLLPRKAAQ